MSHLKIFGMSKSRTFRVLWMAEELGLEYEHIPVDIGDQGTGSAEFLSINPNGRIPAIQDGELTLFESMAINLYLARQYPGRMMPDNPEDEARVIQWSFWAVNELEPGLLTLLRHRATYPEDQRDPQLADATEKELARPLAVLDQALVGKTYLVGEHFSAADLNVASVMAWAKASKVDFSAFPHVAAWMEQCLGRPASRAARR